MRPMFYRLAPTTLNAASLAISGVGIHHFSGIRMIAFIALVAIASMIALAALASSCGGLPARDTSIKGRLLDALIYGLIMGGVYGLEAAISHHVSWTNTILYALCGAVGTGTLFMIFAYAWILMRKLWSAVVRA